MEWKKRRIFVHMAASTYHVISKEVENRVFKHNRIFRHTCMDKQPILTTKWNHNNFLQILHSYLRYTDRLLDVFFLLLAVILSELHENPRKKKLSFRKKCIEAFVWRTSLFWLHALLLMSFFVPFFVYSLPFVYTDFT